MDPSFVEILKERYDLFNEIESKVTLIEQSYQEEQGALTLLVTYDDMVMYSVPLEEAKQLLDELNQFLAKYSK